MNRVHSVIFEVASKYCISDSFVDYDAHSISSKGFLPTGAMLSKSLIQFSVDAWGYFLSLLFVLRPNYGGGNKDNGNLLQKLPCMHCCTQCPRPCSWPLPTHISSTGDSWTLTGKSGSVPCGVTAPFSCVLVHTRLCPPRVFPQSCVSSGGSMVG